MITQSPWPRDQHDGLQLFGPVSRRTPQLSDRCILGLFPHGIRYKDIGPGAVYESDRREVSKCRDALFRHENIDYLLSFVLFISWGGGGGWKVAGVTSVTRKKVRRGFVEFRLTVTMDNSRIPGQVSAIPVRVPVSQSHQLLPGNEIDYT